MIFIMISTFVAIDTFVAFVSLCTNERANPRVKGGIVENRDKTSPSENTSREKRGNPPEI